MAPMCSELELPRKYSLKIGGRTVVFRKKPDESAEHVLCKALTLTLLSDDYPDRFVEYAVGDRYRPDVVSLDRDGEPELWAECGQVGKRKIQALLRRYPRTHFVFLKYGSLPVGFVRLVERAVADVRRDAPVELIALPSDMDSRVASDGTVRIRRADCTVVRLDG